MRTPIHTAPWWKVMCLTGVDYFSTLGYQPGIAFLAAGALAPIATLILVILTLVGALPVYSRVAAASPNGQGSISMLEDLLPRWRGKAFVLVLLGFAATDFVITITLSAADATEHVIHNPFVPAAFDHPVAVTIVLLTALGAVFLKGFKEAIGLAVGIVAIYLALNVVVLAVGMRELLAPSRVSASLDERASYAARQSDGDAARRVSALSEARARPVGVRDRRRGDAAGPRRPRRFAGDAGRTHSEHQKAAAHGRAHHERAAHRQLPRDDAADSTGSVSAKGARPRGARSRISRITISAIVFGTIYDVSTIAILWFAGASAMAGLLNLVPRYLPRYGMAPEWTRATRPLVTLFTGITFLITIIFNADVEAQGGAYATGVLVLMTSAAFAVTLGLKHRPSAQLDGVRGHHADFRLHDDYQRHRAARRRADRDMVHRHDHRHLAHLARAAIDRAARAGRHGRSDGRSVSPRGRERADPHHREPAGHGIAR